MAYIGIKTADGGFFRVCKEETTAKKRVRLVPAREDQTSVQIDLFRGDTERVNGAEYIGSLLLEEVSPDADGESKLDLILELDAEKNLHATVNDVGSGSYQSFSVNLDALDEAGGYDIPDFSLDDDQIDDVTVESIHDDLDDFSAVDTNSEASEEFERELEQGLLEDDDELADTDFPDAPQFDSSYGEQDAAGMGDYSLDSDEDEDEYDDEQGEEIQVRKIHPLLLVGIILIVLAALLLSAFGIFLLIRGGTQPPLQALRQTVSDLFVWGLVLG